MRTSAGKRRVKGFWNGSFPEETGMARAAYKYHEKGKDEWGRGTTGRHAQQGKAGMDYKV